MAKRGVYTFRIHGTVHHSIGQLLPKQGERRAFAQIYIHDGTPESEVEHRQQHLGEASLPELRCLQDMMHQHNPYVFYFKHGIEVMKEHGGVDVRMTIRADGVPDPRRYNAPTSPEIAVIMPGDGNGEQEVFRDIVLHARNETERELQFINEANRAYDPLHYVLLFPLGEDGWHSKIPVRQRKRTRYSHGVLLLQTDDQRQFELPTSLWQTVSPVCGRHVRQD